MLAANFYDRCDRLFIKMFPLFSTSENPFVNIFRIQQCKSQSFLIPDFMENPVLFILPL